VIQAIQHRLAARQNGNDEGGFTLIELMVVVMIIAILVGIAIPAFLGARRRAQDTASKSDLRNALGTAQTIFTDNQAYPTIGGTPDLIPTLTNEEPSLTFLDGSATGAGHTSTTAKQISVNTKTSAATGASGTDEIILASESGSGNCFFLRHVATAGSAGLSGSYMATLKQANCSAADAPADAAKDASGNALWQAL
jgi:prepilin-type N-terminal cleavage/methylation domain-containing protein